MAKKKIIEILLRGKEFIISKKKEVAVATGVILLGVIGFGAASILNNESLVENNNTNNVVASGNKLDKEDKKDTEDNKETDKVEEIVENDKNSDNNSETENTVKEDKEDVVSEETSSTNNSSNNSQSSESSNSSSSNNGGNQVTPPSNNNNSSSNNSGGNTSSKPSHTHSWNPVTETVWHDEVGHWEDVIVTPAWTEEVPVYEELPRSICNGCGKDITGNTTEHIKEQALAGNYACGGYHVEYVKTQTGTNTINHPAVTEKKWIVDKAGWSETVTTGYKCSCGATK